MKKNTFKKFIASLGVAVLVTSNIGSALTPLTIYAAEDNSEGESPADVSEAEPAAEENSEPEEAEPASVEESEPEESNEGAYSDDAGSGNEGGQESSEENADEAGSEDPSGEEAAEDTVPEESDEIDTSDESASLDASLDEEAELNDSVNTEEGQNKEKRSLTVKVKAVKKSGGSIIDGNEEEIDFDDDDIIDLTKDTDDFSTEIEIGGCKYTYVDAAYKDDVITAIKTNIKSETDSEIITETKFTSDKEFKNFTDDSSWNECFDESDIKDHKAVITLNYSKVEIPVIKEEPAEKVTEETTEAATVESTEEAEETKKTEEAGKDNSESKEESSEASSTEKTEDKKEDTSNIEETVSHKFYGEAIADGTALSDKAFELTVEGAADVAELAPEYDGYSFVEAQYDGTVITAIDKDAVEANGTWTEISKDVTDVTVSFYYEAVEDTTEETDKETADDKKTEADEKTYEITATFKENKKDKVFTFTPVDGSDTVVLDLTEEQVSIEDISDQYYTGTLKLTDAWIGLCKITSVSKYGYVKLNGDGEVVPFTSDTNIIFHYDEEESTLISGLDKVFGNLLLPKTAEGSLSFNEFDLDNNTVYWSILVDKTEDAKWPISDVVITEAEMKYGYGVDAELVNDMSVVWDDLKVSSEGKTISDESYSVDQENNTVTFEVLDRPVEIIVAAKLSESDTIEADEKFTAVNKVELTADGKDSDEYTATAEYEAEVDESEDESDGVVLDATLVDVFGEPISEEYTNIELPEFNEDGILVLDDADNAPVKDVVVGDEEQGIKKYVYVEASLNDEVITAIKKEVVEADEAAETEESVDEETADTEEAAPAEKIAFFYTTDGENWISIEEDSTVELTYSCEKQSLYVYEDDNVKITVAVPEETVLPNDTQLEVLPILKGTPEYKEVTAAFDNADAAKTEADAEAVEEENKKVEYLYDISFVKEDEEIEPEGEVAVSFEFKHAKIDGEGKPEECEVTVDHLLDDGTVENLDADSKINNKGELKQVDVVTESFSVFRVLAARTAQSTTDTIPEAAYSLEYLLNHYQAVALEGDLELNIHCMGPVLVKGGLSGGGSGFGDSAYTDVSSYIGGYVSYHGPSNSRQETAPHNLYVGTSNTVTDNNTDLNGMADFNKGIRGSDVPGEIYTTDNYVDWARMSGVVSGTVNSIQGLAKNSYEGQWDWQEISVPAGSVVDLKTNGKKIKINITGSSDKTTVINVTDGGNNVLVPMIANVQATEDNRNAPPIAFTFPNATGVKVVADLTPQSGHVIAPNAKITVEGGNYNGCLVGKSIVSNGEGHLWPYKGGSLVPTTAGLNVTKTVDGKTPDTNNFKFTVSELKNGAWQVIDTKKNNGSDVKFSSITYNEAGEHWYLIQEDQTPVQGYILSADKYLLKVSVSAGQSGSLDVTLSSNVTIYKAKENVSANDLISGGKVDTSKLTQINVGQGQTSADVIKFDNTQPGSLKLVKNFTGATLTDDQKNSVSFTITGPDEYREDVSYADFTNDIYEISNLTPGDYYVNENLTDAAIAGYAISASWTGAAQDGKVTVTAGNTSEVAFTNTYTREKGNLKITKSFSGIDPSKLTEDQKKAITFEISGPTDFTTVCPTYNDFTNGVYELKDIPTGTYTVKETATGAVTGYTVSTDGGEGKQAAVNNGPSAEVTITNTYTPSVGKLEIVKDFAGAAITDDQKNAVTFTITGPEGFKTVTTYADFTDGKYVLENLKPGTYTVVETNANVDGYARKTTIDGVGEDNSITVEAGQTATATYTNTYTKGTKAVIEGTKTLTVPEGSSKTLAAGAFTFELTGDGIKEPITTTNDANGNIKFAEFSYSKAGSYNYTIKEVVPSDSDKKTGITYDTKTVSVVVTVTENETTHEFEANVTYDGSTTAPTFSNTYTPAGTDITLEATKSLEGKKLEAGQFTFTLTGEGQDQSKTNDADGKVAFDKISYTKAGTYTYTIKETAGEAGGITYDGSVYTVTVTVTDNGEGQLVATKTIQKGTDNADAVTFENKYETGKVSATLGAKKSLTGRDLAAQEFTFELSAVTDKAPMPETATAQNDGSGNVTFGEIEYSAAGTYEYKITETKGSLGGVTYDETEHTAKVVVTDKGDGTLSAVVTYDGDSEAAPTFSNTYTPAGTDITLEATKSLEGKKLEAGQFTFTLTGEGQDQSKKNDADGKVAFDKISYTKAGTYTYTIKETAGEAGGITYDGSVYTVTVTVTDNGEGQLVATKTIQKGTDNADAVAFENKYETGKVSATLGAKKSLTGRDLAAQEFTFELSAVTDKAPMPETATAQNDGSGNVTFGEIEYSTAGTYEYKITETKGSLGGVTYDETEHTAKVVVTDKGDGTLSAVVTYDGDSEAAPTFSNTYTPAGTDITLEATKSLEGKKLEAGQFTFTLTGEGQDQSKKNDADGKVAFDKISYTKAGTYTYTIKETAGEAGGITYDGSVYTVTVTVTDNGEGQLVATKTIQKGTDNADAVAFENKYETGKVSATLGAKKSLTGRDLAAQEFTFELSAVTDKAPMPETATAQNDGSGNVTFGEIEYSTAGTYEYKITETKGSLGGVTYDETEHTAKVVVTDKGDGTLSAVVTYDGDSEAAPTFSNTYTPAGTDITLEATKSLEGKKLEAGQFTFTLTGEGQDQSKKNDADGKVAFDKISYTKAGTYTYTIKETAGEAGGITYDGSVYTVTVTVTDNGEGQLVATKTIQKGTENADAVTFENKYETGKVSATLGAKKSLTGRDLAAQEFTFELSAVTDKAPMPETATAQNDGSGNVTFGEIEYSAAGTYEYKITEKAGSLGGVTYDETEHTAKVVVTDNGNGTLSAAVTYDGEGTTVPTFSNTYTPVGTDITLEATKSLTGKKLEAGQFTFTLTGSGQDQSKTNDADGKVAFDKISYTKAGTYTYTIKEEAGEAGGITYDGSVYTVTVTVEDDGNGHLTAAKTIQKGTENADAVTFENKYETGKVSATLGAKKSLTGRDLAAQEFTFELSAVTDKAPMPETATAQNDGSGNVTFGEIEYSAAGTYEYKITEKAGSLGGVTYDETEHTAKVVVTDNGNGTLSAAVTYDGEGTTAPIFNNTYTPLTVTIRKTDVAGKELAGAELKLEDEKGNLVEKWTSDGTAKVVTVDPGTYTLVETSAPKGYKVSESITFTVALDSEGNAVVTVDGKEVGEVVMKDDYSDNKVVVKKTDVAGKELAGAELKLEDEKGNVVETWTSDGKAKEIELQPGTYKLTETSAPKGYEVSESITFTVALDSEGNAVVTVNGDEVGAVEMVDDYSDQTVTISKVDAGGKEIKGAEIEVTDKDGNTVDKWTSEEGKSHDITVKPGEYTFKEVSAPEGYEAVTEIKFTVDKDGNVTVTSTETNAAKVDKDGKLVITDELTDRKVKFSKTDIAGDELAGATIVVTGTDAAGRKVEETWTTGETAHELELPMGTYTMTETAAPNGYKIATAIDFKVNANGTITVGKITTESEDKNIVTMVDGYADQTVTISKVDAGGKEIKGAEIEVTDMDGNTVDKWTSEEGKSHDITVKPGEYTFKEVNAPEGYEAVTEIKFTVDKDGNVTVTSTETNAAKVDEDGKLVITDELTDRKVKFSKTDIAGDELAGATIVVTGTDAAGQKVEKTWVSDGKAHELELPMGSYTMTETAAPEGYVIATAIDFTVNANGTITVGEITTESEDKNIVTMVDGYADQTVTIRKTDIAGKELKGADLTVKDEDGNVVEEWTSDGTAKEVTVKPGTYTLVETSAPKGYKVSESITFTVALDSEGNAVVTVDGDEVDEVVMVDGYSDNKVVIKKTDVAGKELAGAVLKLEDEKGELVEQWTSDEKAKEIELQPGKYTLTEISAPEGYEVSKSITFTVALDSEGNAVVTVDDDEVGAVVMVDDYSDQTVTISKVDAGGKEIGGAEIEVTDKDGNTVDKWTSEEGKSHKITVKPGEYTFKEVNAPAGYEAVTEIKFTVDKDGNVTVTSTETNAAKVDEKTGKLVITDELTDRKVKFSKTDIAGDELEGATIVVTGTDAAGQKIEKTWVSDGKAHELELPMGTYTMTETAAPEGYVIATAIDFTVNANGTITVGEITTESEDKNIVTMVDGYADQTVTISKVDAGGKEIGGAEIEVTDKDGNTVEQWTSEKGKSHDITVKPGEYTFKEVNAPAGYEAVTEIKFTVDKDGNVTVTSTETNAAKVDEKTGKLVITDELTDRKVKFSKTDIAGDELAGATIVVTGTDAAGQKIEKTWVSDGKAHELELPMGTYTMTETAAPEGYVIATAIDFTVNANGTITVGEITTESEDKNIVTMVDGYADQTVTIRKTDIAGKELKGAELKVIDALDNVVEQWTSDGTAKKVTVKPGTYTLVETSAPKGYKVSESITFTVALDKKGNAVVTVDGKEVGEVVMVDAYSDKPTTPPGGGDGGGEGGGEGGGHGEQTPPTTPPSPPREVTPETPSVPRNIRLGVPSVPKNMKTGDDGQMPVYGGLSIASLGALLIWIRKRRKKSA